MRPLIAVERGRGPGSRGPSRALWPRDIARGLLAFGLLALGLTGCAHLPFGLGGDQGLDPGAQGPPPEPIISVRVDGLTGAAATNVAAMASLARASCGTRRDLLERQLPVAREEALRALAAFGHDSARVTPRLDLAADCPTLVLVVEPGPRTTIARLDFRIEGEAAADPAFRAALEPFPLIEGAPLEHAAWERLKSRIESVALSLGYLSGRFTRHEIRIDRGQARAELGLHYDSGPQSRLGELAFEQEPGRELEEGLIERFLALPDASPFNAAQVESIRDVLTASGYFSRVDVRPDLEAGADGGAVPVAVRLQALSRHHFSAAVGLSTDQGPRGRLGWELRRLNRQGHRAGVEGRVGLVERSFNTHYRMPRARPAHEWLNFNAGVRQMVVDAFDTVTMTIGLNETKLRPFGIREFRYLAFKRDDFEVASRAGLATLFIPGVRWSLRRTDSPVNVSRGYELALDLRGASREMLSDVSLFRAQLDAVGVRTLPLGFRFLGRTSLGALVTDDFLGLPPPQRFFTGGDESIRGHAFQSLGPTDPTGAVVGGAFLGVVSAELQRDLTRDWGLAGFVDAGNAFEGTEFTDTRLAIGIGLGLRWRSPIGPVKVDLAHPLAVGPGDLRLHVRVGPDF